MPTLDAPSKSEHELLLDWRKVIHFRLNGYTIMTYTFDFATLMLPSSTSEITVHDDWGPQPPEPDWRAIGHGKTPTVSDWRTYMPMDEAAARASPPPAVPAPSTEPEIIGHDDIFAPAQPGPLPDMAWFHAARPRPADLTLDEIAHHAAELLAVQDFLETGAIEFARGVDEALNDAVLQAAQLRRRGAQDTNDYGRRLNATLTHNGEKSNRIKFIDTHLAEARKVAKELGVTTAEILRLSGLEFAWGNGPFAGNGKDNYFSEHAPAHGQSGEETITYTDKEGKLHHVRVAHFASYRASIESWAHSYGNLVKGITDPTKFAAALQNAGKYGINPDGSPVAPYVREMTKTINGVQKYIDEHSL